MLTAKFTKTFLNTVQPDPAGKRCTYYDTEIPKLAVAVTAVGTKTFFVIKRVVSKVVWIKLGRYPEMSVDQARLAAIKVLGEIVEGVDPTVARKNLKGEPTLSEFFTDEYGPRHGVNKRSWNDDQQRFRRYLSKQLGELKLSEITRSQMSNALNDAARAGKAVSTVRSIRALISHMFGKAEEWGFIEINPARGLKVEGKAVSRDRFLNQIELVKFMDALALEDDHIRDIFLLALLTGARRANICSMQWNEINLLEAQWRIPKTKNGEAQTVLLSPPAVEILQARQDKLGGAGFVFPGTGKTEHFVDTRTAIKRVLDRAGIPYGRNVQNGVTLHDLRRTLGSWQAISGSSLQIIGGSLGHKSPAATAIYSRLNTQAIRDSVEKADARMLSLAGLKEGESLVQFLNRMLKNYFFRCQSPQNGSKSVRKAALQGSFRSFLAL
ncbi:MAG: tyrosine-type recombinase/integrase [Betaproteobacteria bacterium]|nr:tyrosine-type recombinase/integrase [Betaproteobacteria bacterium]